MNTNEKAAYSVNEFLSAYSIGRTKFYQEVAEGRLRVRKSGGRTLIAKADADAWLESLPIAA